GGARRGRAAARSDPPVHALLPARGPRRGPGDVRQHGRAARLRRDRGAVPGARRAAPRQAGARIDGVALPLVLVAAGAHATWTLLAKRAEGGAELIWLYGAVGVVLWAPVAAADLAIEGGVTWAGVGFMLGSAVLHIFYYGALQSSYRHGELSVVYPLARGSGPVLSVTAAILFLGERPSALGLAGGALIVLAVLALAAG